VSAFSEPWSADFGTVRDARSRQVADEIGAELSSVDEGIAFMRRIVACVNYCDGLSTDWLEESVALRRPGTVLVESPVGITH
jgi:hypothetical protein